MPLTDYACPECGGCLHTDDLLEGECVTPGCGAEFDAGLGKRDDLPEYDPETAPEADHTIVSEGDDA